MYYISLLKLCINNLFALKIISKWDDYTSWLWWKTWLKKMSISIFIIWTLLRHFMFIVAAIFCLPSFVSFLSYFPVLLIIQNSLTPIPVIWCNEQSCWKLVNIYLVPCRRRCRHSDFAFFLLFSNIIRIPDISFCRREHCTHIFIHL